MTKEEEVEPSRLAAILRRERKSQEALRAARAERDALAREKAEIAAFRERLKTSPLEALSDAGLTYEELTNRWVLGQQPTAQAAQVPSRELLELKERLERYERAQEQQLRQTQIQADLALAVKVVDDAERFPTMNRLKSASLANELPPDLDPMYQAVELMSLRRSKGEDMDIEEACEIVERHMGKLLAKLTPAQQAAVKAQEATKPKRTAATPPREPSGKFRSPEKPVNPNAVRLRQVDTLSDIEEDLRRFGIDPKAPVDFGGGLARRKAT